MTLIVGIVDKDTGTVHMGADRIVVLGMGKSTMSTPKIFKKGEFIIGSAGYLRGINLLEHVFEIPNISDDEKDITKYMVKEFVPALIKCFKDNQFYTKESEMIINEQQILFGVRGRLYSMFGSFEISEHNSNYATSGYGMYHANGMIEYALKTENRKDYIPLIKDVIKNVCNIVNYVSIGDLDVDVLSLKKIKSKKTVFTFEDGTNEEIDEMSK